MKKNLEKILICLLLFIATLGLTGCELESIEKGSSIATFNYTLNPIQDTNNIKVNYTMQIQNNSIFNMTGFKFKVDLYNNDVFIKSSDYIYEEATIIHGKLKIVKGSFNLDNAAVDRLELKTWTSNDLNFWQTYKIWIIVIAIISILGSIGYAIWVFVEDLEIDDVWYTITDLDYWWLILLIPFLSSPLFGGLIPILNIGWVPLCLILAGFIIFILLALFVNMIHYFISNFGCKTEYSYYEDEEDEEDEENLDNLTKEELIKYCRDNNISGYSNLRKQEIIELIENNNNEEESKNQKPNAKLKQLKKSNITFDSIAGLDEAKRAFKEKVILPFQHPEIFEKFNKKSGGGILLYGLPGTGKTMFAEACSNEVDALFIPIKCSDIKSKWYGESEQNIKKIFDKARKAEKAIIFFDEFEAIGSKRTDESDNGNNDLVPEILAEMQGIGSNSKSTIVVIAATNKPWAIDSAFMRPGRFDEKIYIPLPDYEARLKLFSIHLNKVPKESDLNINYLANITEGFNGADIKEVCEKIKMIGITKSLETNQEHKISNNDIKLIESTFKSSVSEEDIERLEEFENR